MAEVFSKNAKKIIELAEDEAKRLNRTFLGTLPLLIVLIKTKCSANTFLGEFVDLNELGLAIERPLRKSRLPRSETIVSGSLPKTPNLKKIIQHAVEGARILSKDYVGTGFLLLGILKQKESLAALILSKFGLTFENSIDKLTEFLRNN